MVISILPTRCSKCGVMVETFYNKDTDAWFSKYLKDNEDKICLDCIKDRDGFKQEFLDLFGLPLDEVMEGTLKGFQACKEGKKQLWSEVKKELNIR